MSFFFNFTHRGIHMHIFSLLYCSSHEQWKPNACFEDPEMSKSILHSFSESEHVLDTWTRAHGDYMLGAVYFSQRRNESRQRGFAQSGIVVLSELPFPVLLKHVAQVVGHAYEDTKAVVTLELAYHNMAMWETPKEGQVISLPLLGSILEYLVPCFSDKSFRSKSHSPVIEGTSGMSLEDSTSYNRHDTFSDVGLYRTLSPFLDHLWHLWSMVIRGKIISVHCTDASLCGDLVFALVSLVSPLRYCGDFRPYITIHDPDSWAIGRYVHTPSNTKETQNVNSASSKVPSQKISRREIKTPSPQQNSRTRTEESKTMDRLTLTPPRRTMSPSKDRKSRSALSKLRNLWTRSNTTKTKRRDSPSGEPLQLGSSRDAYKSGINGTVGIILGFSNPLLWRHFGNADAGLNINLGRISDPSSKVSLMFTLYSQTQIKMHFLYIVQQEQEGSRLGEPKTRCQSSSENTASEESNCEKRQRAPTVSSFSQEPIKCSTNLQASPLARQFRHLPVKKIAVPQSQSLNTPLERAQQQKGLQSRITFLYKDDFMIPPSKTILRQLLSIDHSTEEGEQLRLNTSSTNVPKGDNKAKVESTAEGEIPAVVINDSILSKHFRELTTGFLRPFKKYFELQLDNVAVASSNLCQSGTQANTHIALGPYDDFHKYLLHTFSPEEFLKGLDKATLPKPVRKCNYKRLYMEFMQTPTFSYWFRGHRKNAEESIFSLTRTLRFSLTPPVLSEQLENLQESNGVDSGAPAEQCRILLDKIVARINSERERLHEDIELLEHMKSHLSITVHYLHEYDPEYTRKLSIEKKTYGFMSDSDVFS